MPIPEQFIPKFYKSGSRMREVAGVLFKYGFFWVAEALDLTRYFPRRLREKVVTTEEYRLPLPVRIRRVIEELGPTYVKAGQLLSTRPDIVPPEVIRELSKLQDEVPPFDFARAQEVVEKELNRPIDTVFQSFARLPIASASIGQVHEAVLKDGREVVVKVQRPGIRETIEVDTYIMNRLAMHLEKMFWWARQYNLVERVEEFSKSIVREMDYTIEGQNADRFRRNFQGDTTVHIPDVLWDFTTRRILIMEYLHGIPIRDKDTLVEKGYDLVAINDAIGNAYVKQILLDGYFHADPHFGNILILENQVIGLLDFGMVGVVDPIMRRNMARYFIALVEQDAESLTDVIYEIAEVDPTTDRDALTREAGRMMAKYANVHLGRIRLEEIAMELFQIGMKYRIKLPGEFTMMDKTLITLEGLGRHLHPDFDLIEAAQPTARMLFRRELDPQKMLASSFKGLLDLRDLLNALPRRLDKITRAVERGEYKSKTEIINLNTALREYSKIQGRSFNRLAVAIVIGALILALPQLATLTPRPLVFGLDAVHAAFAAAAALGAVWLVSTFRSWRK